MAPGEQQQCCALLKAVLVECFQRQMKPLRLECPSDYVVTVTKLDVDTPDGDHRGYHSRASSGGGDTINASGDTINASSPPSPSSSSSSSSSSAHHEPSVTRRPRSHAGSSFSGSASGSSDDEGDGGSYSSVVDAANGRSAGGSQRRANNRHAAQSSSSSSRCPIRSVSDVHHVSASVNVQIFREEGGAEVRACVREE
jgi:hypothetical protein